jgi:hypothetical protein
MQAYMSFLHKVHKCYHDEELMFVCLSTHPHDSPLKLCYGF